MGLSRESVRVLARHAALFVNLSGNLRDLALVEGCARKVYVDSTPATRSSGTPGIDVGLRATTSTSRSAPGSERRTARCRLGHRLDADDASGRACSWLVVRIERRTGSPPLPLGVVRTDRTSEAVGSSARRLTSSAVCASFHGVRRSPSSWRLRSIRPTLSTRRTLVERGLATRRSRDVASESRAVPRLRPWLERGVLRRPRHLRRDAVWLVQRPDCGAIFLAASPALVQDTGFGDSYRAGEGLVFVSSRSTRRSPERPRHAADYAAHCRAARAFAEEHLDSDSSSGDCSSRSE